MRAFSTWPAIVIAVGLIHIGCSDSSRSRGGATASATTSASATATTTSSSTAASGSGATGATTSATAINPPPAGGPPSAPPFNPATTVTVVAGGFGLGGATASGTYGIDEPSRIATNVAAKLGIPTGIAAPNAPNQITVVAYYGSTPPGYYSAQDLAEVNAAGPGVPRYARIIAKAVTEILRRSGATHVNLGGGSFGGLITRYVIEHDLEGHASSGRIVRWLTLEGAVAGSYFASRLTSRPVLLQLLAHFSGSSVNAADIDDMRTGTYDFLRRVFNTPEPDRSTSPHFRSIIVAHQIATDGDINSHLLSTVSGEPNDGVLLVEDQQLTRIDARPVGPAVAQTDTTHYTTARDEGALTLMANFLRSRRRVRIRLLDAQIRDFSEGFLFGRGEITFDAEVFSPEALREWGVTDPLTRTTEDHGTARMRRADRGDTVRVDQTVFDWFVAPAEQTLDLRIEANEIDQNLFYGVVEHHTRKTEHMDTATISLPVAATGTTTHAVDTPSFRLNVEVRITRE